MRKTLLSYPYVRVFIIIIGAGLMSGLLLKAVSQPVYRSGRASNISPPPSPFTLFLPDTLTNFPIFPQATEASTISSSTFSRSWLTQMPIPEAAAWYINNLPAQGWTLTNLPTLPEDHYGQTLTARKGSIEAILAFTREDLSEPVSVYLELSSTSFNTATNPDLNPTIYRSEHSEPDVY